MYKVFYITLLGIFFYKGCYCDVSVLSNSLSDDKFNLESEPFGLYPPFYNRERRYQPSLSDHDAVSKNKNAKQKRSRKHKGRRSSIKKPTNFSYNFQKLPTPTNNVGVMETLSDSDKDKKEELIEKTFSKTITREKQPDDAGKSDGSSEADYDEIIDDLKKMLKETENVERKLLRRRRDEDKKEVKENFKKGYLDYTNSQMPFNEGQPLKSEANQKRNKRTGTCLGKGEEAQCKERKMKSLPKRLDDLFQSKDEKAEVLSDDAEYSRVRRFLHRAGRRKRYKSITLETKEAAMSRVLDPNLNVDGILEPHVRKRRVNENFNQWLEEDI